MKRQEIEEKVRAFLIDELEIDEDKIFDDAKLPEHRNDQLHIQGFQKIDHIKCVFVAVGNGIDGVCDDTVRVNESTCHTADKLLCATDVADDQRFAEDLISVPLGFGGQLSHFGESFILVGSLLGSAEYPRYHFVYSFFTVAEIVVEIHLYVCG